MSSHVLDGITRPARNGMPLKNPGLHSSPGLSNRLRLAVYGPDGELKQLTPWMENVLNTYGLDSFARQMGTGAGAVSAIVSIMAIGTGTNTPTSTDTALQASTFAHSINEGAGIMIRTTGGAMIAEYQATYQSNQPAGAATINEVGLFCGTNAAGSMFSHATLGTNNVNKGASDTINISYDIQFKTST